MNNTTTQPATTRAPYRVIGMASYSTRTMALTALTGFHLDGHPSATIVRNGFDRHGYSVGLGRGSRWLVVEPAVEPA